MDDLGTNSAAPLDPRSTREPSAGSVHELSQLSPLLPQLSPGSEDGFADWETIGERRGFYDEQDFLNPSYSLASEKLKNRKEDDVVIFDYPIDPNYLSCLGGNPPVEGGGPSLGRVNGDTERFFRAPRDKLVESEQFNRVINSTKEPRLAQPKGLRLGIIDFPQCYDTYDDSLLNLMGEKLGLLREGETTFMDSYSQRVRALPGRGRFRTGISLRASFKKPSGLLGSGSSEDRFILFVSFPYFGGSREEITLGPESESVQLTAFKSLGTDVPRRTPLAGEGRDDIGEMLVHQTRYMIFDNYTMATFRSKEDSAKDQVPLHRFQECIGTFRAMIHMIGNRMDSELWVLGKLQASFYKQGGQEEDIDQIISDTKTYEDNQGILEASPDELPQPSLGILFTKDYEKIREKIVRKIKQRSVRNIASFNRISAGLFSAIKVAERQIVILQNLHTVFLTSYLTKTNNREKRYPLPQNLFCKDVAPIPVLSEFPEQLCPNILDAIDEVVRGRKSFIREIKELVEILDVKRKILFGFLGSAPNERIEDALGQLSLQTQAGSTFTACSLGFLPLGFCASYFSMNNIKEFTADPISLSDFWSQTAIICLATILPITLLSFSESLRMLRVREYARKGFNLARKEKIDDVEI
ncbi:hypothetical protein B9Z19DRAFT_1061389 [Tuber borchii]|uniref:Uncharacterized protein n=1 Tax=Tuber borchii TaxID=42251 RepID=A0A2T7A5D8_TUBBO|nr:hypothetical protein B9Z19DRAFT_1061389 [Tuber borchii]